MARGGISFEGIKAGYTTYKLKATDNFTSADEGKALTVTANQEAGYGSAGGSLLGKLVVVEGDGLGTIQDSGYATFGYPVGQAPAYGSCVVVNGAGLVSQAATGYIGRSNIVVERDDVNYKVVVFLG